MTIADNIYEPAPPDLAERRRRALLLRLAAIREMAESDQACYPALAHDFGMTDYEIEQAVERVREAL